jgi:hypothetical protein
MDDNCQWLYSIVHKHHPLKEKSLIDQDYQEYDKQAPQVMCEEIEEP